MHGRLADKRAIVTGGARGIGEATVRKMAAEGARVALLDIDAEAGAATAADVPRTPHTVLSIQSDITDEDQVATAVQAVVEAFGGVDILVNNAGVNLYHDAEAMTSQEWDTAMAVDLKGAWLCAKHLLPWLRESGGNIVNIASIHATMTTAGMFPYAAAKSGLVGMTRSLALDYGRRGVRVNAVCPGWTRTFLVEEWFQMQDDPAAAEASVLDVHPMGRIGTPQEIANLVAFVASDEASFITGAALAIDGGLSIRYAT